MEMLEKLHAVEQDLQATELLLQSIARTLPEPIFIIDEFGKYLDVIGGKERSLFHTGKFLVSKHLHDILPEALADTFMLTISEAVKDNSLKTLEYRVGSSDITGLSRAAQQGKQWFEGRVYPIQDSSSDTRRVIWLAVDITARKNLEEQLLELSEKDELTGACNRRYFMQIFDQEYSIAQRYKSKLSVLLIDIDNLKTINETYGIEGGDAVLKRFTVFCRDTLRQSDLFARYSGGEFVIMLPETPRLGAAIIAERIRANTEEVPVPYGKEKIPNTISIGISLVQDTDTSSNAVLSRADAALYLAKKNGRNRIEIL